MSVPEGSEFTLDLNGHKLTMEGPGAGSPGTKTLAFQFLKDSTITIKNGTLAAKDTDEIKMLIQNYSNLTLDNVKLIGTEHIQYLCSDNYGTVVFKNGTEFNVVGNGVAFDVWYGLDKNGAYDNPGVFVTVADDSVKVNGPVEYGKQSRASDEDFRTKSSLTVPVDMDINFRSKPSDFDWVDNGDGTKTLKYSGT